MKALDVSSFEKFSQEILHTLKEGEELTLSMSGESTHFARLSHGRIRQASDVEQAFVHFNFIKGQKVLNFSMPFTGGEKDVPWALQKMAEARTWSQGIPEDPYAVRPQFYGSTREEKGNPLPKSAEMVEAILENARGTDLAGVYSQGDVVRATTNSKGQFHWFKTRNFSLDYSLYNDKQKAVKSLWAGADWDPAELKRNIEDTRYKLSLMDRPAKKILRGEYRVYLAPGAVSELLGTLSWGGLSMSAHQEGHGSLKDLWQGKRKLSEKFTLKEDFSLGLAPRFNEAGEVCASELTLIERGNFAHFLISSRTANEYKLATNFANDFEGLRSPRILTGDLSREDILKKLDTGLYLSNLHYLNWSDRETARVTGMTRYACFWVENGEIVSPIEDLRFDESYYNIFGNSLLALTDFAEVSPATDSYFERAIGGTKTPGALLSHFKFTL